MRARAVRWLVMLAVGRTAKALGLAVFQRVLVLADQVIE